jgi:hypothetical protein
MFGWHLIIEHGLIIGLKFFLSITEQITNLTLLEIKNSFIKCRLYYIVEAIGVGTRN